MPVIIRHTRTYEFTQSINDIASPHSSMLLYNNQKLSYRWVAARHITLEVKYMNYLSSTRGSVRYIPRRARLTYIQEAKLSLG